MNSQAHISLDETMVVKAGLVAQAFVLGKLQQKDYCEFETNPGKILSQWEKKVKEIKRKERKKTKAPLLASSTLHT